MKIRLIRLPMTRIIIPSGFGFIRFACCVWLVCCAWAAHSTRARSAEPIKIGAVLPFSGGVELYGQQATLGLDLAAKDLNAAGGALGRASEGIYADDKD